MWIENSRQILRFWLGGYGRLWHRHRVIVLVRQPRSLAGRYNSTPESTISPSQRLGIWLQAGLWIVKDRHVSEEEKRQAGMMLIGPLGFRCRQQSDPSACHQAARSHPRPWICPPPSHQTSNKLLKFHCFGSGLLLVESNLLVFFSQSSILALFL